MAGQQQQLIKTLENLLKLPENRDCADCGVKAPTWASTNIGVFICIRCAGIHRAMGTHISKVKSTSLDKWQPEQVEVMQKVGNAKARDIYEANVDGHHKGDIKNDNIALEQWIRDKYEHKRFMKRDYESRPVQHASSQNNHHHSSHSHPHHHQQPPSALSQPPPSRPRAPSGGSSNAARPRGPSGGASSLPAPTFAPAHKQPPAPAAKPAAKSTADDLLNWDEPAPAPATSASASGGDIFGDFVTATTTPAQPAVDKNSIMQLFHPPIAPAAHIVPGYPYGVPPPHPSYPAPNYNIPGLGVPGAVPPHVMGYPPQGVHPQMGHPQMGGVPPMMGYPQYPPVGGVPGYPPVGGVPGYYGIPGQQMGMRPNIPNQSF